MALADRQQQTETDLTYSGFLEELLDRLSFDMTDERPRLKRALQLVVVGLERHFRGRIHGAWALYREYERAERHLPIVVVADFAPEDGFDLEMDMAGKVFGPIRKRTRVRMPVDLVTPEQISDYHVTDIIGRLYPMEGS